MSIARLTNVADFDTLLEEIRDFLVATGDWVIEEDLRSPTEGAAAGGRELIVSNGDVLAGLRSTTTGNGANRMYLFDGFPPYSSSNIDAMNDNSGIVMTDATYTNVADANARVINPAFAGPFPTVFLFSDDPSTYCHVAIEVIAGRYRHIFFGNMRKFGTWIGGSYYAMTRWNQSAIFVDVPNSTNHHTPFDESNPTQGAADTFYYDDGIGLWRSNDVLTFNGVVRQMGTGTVRSGFGQAMRNIQETPFSGLIALQPITVWFNTVGDVPDTVRCVGQVRDVAMVNMRNLQPGESYFIGSDEWIVFPLTQKRDPAERLDVENSGYYGVGYLVVP